MKTHDDAGAWHEVRDRLAEIDAGLSGSCAPDQRLIEEVYRRRARQLADRQAGRAESSTLAVLAFGLGTERYAVELSDLAEVFPYRGSTAVPGAPPALLGVINVRGDIKPVVDLRSILGLRAGDGGGAGYVLMLRQAGRAIGFKVDAIDQVCQIDPSDFVSTGDDGATIPGSRFIKGLTADGLILLDTGAALSHLGPTGT